MNTDTQEKVTTKLFVGFILTPEVRIALNQSAAWKQAKIIPDDKELKEQPFQGKEYLGQFWLSDQIPIDQLRFKEVAIRARLRHYCPGLSCDTLSLYLLPVTFIT